MAEGVLLQVVTTREAFSTQATLVFSLSSVNAEMPVKFIRPEKVDINPTSGKEGIYLVNLLTQPGQLQR